MNSFQRCLNETQWNHSDVGLKTGIRTGLTWKNGKATLKGIRYSNCRGPSIMAAGPKWLFFEFPGVRTLAGLSLNPESVSYRSGRSGYAGFAILRCLHSEIHGWGKSQVSWWRRFYRCSIHIFSGSTKNPMGSGRGNQATGSSSIIPSATAST